VSRPAATSAVVTPLGPILLTVRRRGALALARRTTVIGLPLSSDTIIVMWAEIYKIPTDVRLVVGLVRAVRAGDPQLGMEYALSATTPRSDRSCTSRPSMTIIVPTEGVG